MSEKVIALVAQLPKGRVCDLGCGHGDSAKRLSDLGFTVTAADMDAKCFGFKDEIPFQACTLDKPLPFADGYFDYVLFLEVIEHLYNPGFVMKEISRVLKEGGVLVLSTPNILNLASRLRFLFEGAFDFFREPTLDYAKVFPAQVQNMHVIPWRYQELEYLLDRNGLRVEGLFTDSLRSSVRFLAFLIKPLFALQMKSTERHSRRKGGVDYRRIHKLLLSDELLLGRHLILEARKK